jgi:acetyl-CoA carboxylase carboxyl transferase subunit beta
LLGPRVVKDTTGKTLPEGFQTANFIRTWFLRFYNSQKELKDKR